MYQPIIEKNELISLDEETHTYTLQKSNTKFTSVTEFISTFFEPFHETEIAKKLTRMNKYKGKTVEDFLKEWEYRRLRGTTVHKEIEDYLINKNKQVNLNNIDPKSKQGIHFLIQKCMSEKNHLFPEVRIYSEELKLAGTIDLLIYNKEKNHISLIDWKTNIEIKKTGYKKGLRFPLTSIDDCSFNKYSLQLCTYKHILERYYGSKIVGLYIVHLKENNFEYLNCDLQKDYIINMLQAHLEEN